MAVLFFCLNSSLALADTHPKMPSWFWDPPLDSEATSMVGYSRLYYYPENSFKEAFDDAAWRLWIDRGAKYSTSLVSSTHHSNTFLVNNTINISVDTSGFCSFKRELVRLDSMSTDELVVMLVATSQINVDISRRRSPELIQSPHEYISSRSLVEASEISESYLFALGLAGKYFYFPSSWNSAEWSARRDLVLGLYSDVTVNIRATEDIFVSSSVRETDIYVEGIRTIARRFMADTGIVFVWVSIPTSSGN